MLVSNFKTKVAEINREILKTEIKMMAILIKAIGKVHYFLFSFKYFSAKF